MYSKSLGPRGRGPKVLGVLGPGPLGPWDLRYLGLKVWGPKVWGLKAQGLKAIGCYVRESQLYSTIIQLRSSVRANHMGTQVMIRDVRHKTSG